LVLFSKWVALDYHYVLYTQELSSEQLGLERQFVHIPGGQGENSVVSGVLYGRGQHGRIGPNSPSRIVCNRDEIGPDWGLTDDSLIPGPGRGEVADD
jgi:hypothetical protein